MKLLQALTLIPALLILSLSIESANAKPLTKTYRDGLTVEYYPDTNVTVFKSPNPTKQRTQGHGKEEYIHLPTIKDEYTGITVRGCTTRMVGKKTITTCL